MKMMTAGRIITHYYEIALISKRRERAMRRREGSERGDETRGEERRRDGTQRAAGGEDGSE
jgi:hypothetical protein